MPSNYTVSYFPLVTPMQISSCRYPPPQVEHVFHNIIHIFSSHRRCSVVLKNFTKFTGKHLGQSLFLNKVAGLRPHPHRDALNRYLYLLSLRRFTAVDIKMSHSIFRTILKKNCALLAFSIPNIFAKIF